MSWGSLDIVVLSKIGNYRGLGIQVKRVYAGSQPKINIKKIEEDSRQINVIPILAIVKMPEKEVEYCDPKTNICRKNLWETINTYKQEISTEQNNKPI